MELRGCRLEHLAATLADDAIVYSDVHRALPDRPDTRWDEVAASITNAMQTGVRSGERSELVLATFRACSWRLGRPVDPLAPDRWSVLDDPPDESLAGRLWGERNLWALLTRRSFRGLRPSEGVSWGWLRLDELERIRAWAQHRAFADARYGTIDVAIERAVDQRCDLLAYDSIG